MARALTSPARQDRMAGSPRKALARLLHLAGFPSVTLGIIARTADSTVEPLVAKEGRAASPVKAFSCRRRGPKASFGVPGMDPGLEMQVLCGASWKQPHLVVERVELRLALGDQTRFETAGRVSTVFELGPLRLLPLPRLAGSSFW